MNKLVAPCMNEFVALRARRLRGAVHEQVRGALHERGVQCGLHEQVRGAWHERALHLHERLHEHLLEDLAGASAMGNGRTLFTAQLNAGRTLFMAQWNPSRRCSRRS